MGELFDETQRRRIAARSRTLLERLQDTDAYVYKSDESAAEEVLEAWRELYPDEDAFEKRLAQLDAGRDAIERAATVDRLADDRPVPEWVDRLESIGESVSSTDPDQYPEYLVPNPEQWVKRDRPKPFGPLSAAIAEHARRQLDSSVEDVLSDESIGIMQEWFRVRFERRFSRILYVEFKTYVAANDPELARASPEEFSTQPTEYYDRFVDALFSDAFPALCEEYPVFGRLVTTQVRQWKEHLAEFSHRLEADYDSLAETFADDGELGDVVEVYSLADDTHGDGRAIMRVTFESGVTVAYKPRSVDAGRTFYEVLADLAEHLPYAPETYPTFLCRDGYGWMEWIDDQECETVDDVEQYYRRAGSLACLAYLLEFTDCHLENLVASGSTPVLVDAETIFHPDIGAERAPMPTDIKSFVQNSVLLSMLLPHNTGGVQADLGGGDVPELMAGFGVSSDEAELTHISSPQLVAVNTDVMSVEHEHPVMDRSQNIPTVDGEDHPPDDYVSEVESGFRSTYEAILELRDDGSLADDVRLFERFDGVTNRIVYRPTQLYARVLRTLCSRPSLADGARFGVAMEELTVPFCDGTVAGNAPWELYDAERFELKRLDPPRFTCKPNETAIEMGSEPTTVKAKHSGMEQSRERLESASEEDLATQVELLRGALGAEPDPSPTRVRPVGTDWPAVDDERLRSEAASMFDRIRRLGSDETDENPTWARIESMRTTDRLTIHPFDETLHVGTTGIAVLAAGLHRLVEDPEYAAFARELVEPTVQTIQSDTPVPSLLRHGGVRGIGSVVYGLTIVGTLLDDDRTLRSAVRAANYLRDDAFGDDDQYDVSDGSAGTILGLLALEERVGDDELLSIAVEQGDRLLENRVESAEGFRVWRTLDDSPPPVGFLHGSSGIAYALVRLSAAAGNDDYFDAAIEALKHENLAYSRSDGNWRDRRPWAPAAFTDRWSYGRAGIGLSRLGMLEYADHELFETDLERAVHGTANEEPTRVDNLVDGNCGRIEFLTDATVHAGLAQSARNRALEELLAHKREAGRYRMSTERTHLPDLTVIGGEAGIAYTLLRAVDPEALPCVLRFE